MGAGELLADAVERRPMGTHDRRSGARWNGSGCRTVPVWCSRAPRPASTWSGSSCGTHASAAGCSGDRSSALPAGFTGDVDRELALVATGVLDTLPAGIVHAIVDAWRDGADVLMLMRDVALDAVEHPDPHTQARELATWNGSWTLAAAGLDCCEPVRST